jgi:hypothetical protein
MTDCVAVVIPATSHATRKLGITKSAMGLHQLANPGHKLMVGRVAARKTQEPSSISDRIVQIGRRFSPSQRMREIGAAECDHASASKGWIPPS